MGDDVLTSPAAMRRQNTLSVLKSVRVDGPLSRSGIARRTGLSKPTVNEIVAALLAQNYLRETNDASARQERTGPRANLLAFVADIGFVLGIDLSFYKVTVAIADLKGTPRVTDTRVLTPAQQGGPDLFVEAISQAVERALVRARISLRQVWAVGIGVPGAYDPASGAIRLAPTLAQWEQVPLGTMLRELFDCPVLIENEVHLSVLAEQRWGGAASVDHAVYLHAGIGLALGLLIRGEIYRGADGIAGEIGYMVGSSDDPEGSTSSFGPFEWAAGGLAFARMARQAVAAGRGSAMLARAGGRADRIDARLVFEAARDGDVAAESIVAAITERLAVGIANVCCVLNPAVVILGAGLSQAGSQLLDPLKAHVARLIPMPPRRFIVSELGPRAVVLGALEHALRTIEDAKFNLFVDPANAVPAREAALA